MKWERVAIFSFGVVFVTALLVLAFVFPNPTLFQYKICRIVIAIAVASVSALLPGSLHFRVKTYTKASGAFAVFVIVYFYSPAGMVVNEIKSIENIRSLIDDGFLPDAEKALENAIEIYPKSDKLYNLQGSMFVRGLEYTKAVSSFSKAIELSYSAGDQSHYIYNRSAVYLLSGKYEQAIGDLNIIAEQNPNDPSILFSMGIALSRTSRFDEAREKFMRVLEIDRSGAEIYFADVELQIGIIHLLEAKRNEVTSEHVRLAIHRFQEAVCRKADIRDLFLIEKWEIDKFYYDDEFEIIDRIKYHHDYQDFLYELSNGKVCWIQKTQTER